MDDLGRFAANLSQIILVVALHYTFYYKIILNMVICCHYSLQEHPYTWMTSWTSWWVFVAIKATFLHWRTPFYHPDNPDGFALRFKKYMTHLYLLQQDDKGCWWPALGMFWGAKITTYIFTILVFYHPNLLIFWALLTILIFGWFWLLDNLDFWKI